MLMEEPFEGFQHLKKTHHSARKFGKTSKIIRKQKIMKGPEEDFKDTNRIL